MKTVGSDNQNNTTASSGEPSSSSEIVSGKSIDGMTMQVIDPIYDSGSMTSFPMNTTEIINYEKMINEITTINPINGPYYMMNFLKAKELAAQYYARASYEWQSAKDLAKRRYSVVRLDYAPEILKEKGLRVTEAAMDAVADQDQEYLKIKNKEAYFKAMMNFMAHKVDKFQSAHDDAKKIFDQSRDPRGSLPAAPSSMPDYSSEDFSE